ncbi:Arm DNA-binding domain-containing protein [Proteus mirabilis]|uniref:Arm DNA-binding domain-containing protein n=1 Tax=Proteus mirabilis TaxID=584 RepID=UPI00229DCF2D|nr:DUF4102 domain-containing protein [Proteus mirabilis]ELD1834197.1 DUF4102 domain-containing protein [Proteus mirabilis]HCT9099715.1 DUF4102 domain-containing protein [Proteus mirabilis]
MPPETEKIVTNQKIASLDTKDKAYKFSIGEGLYLLVKPNGAKYWRMKYRINGKEKSLSFGVYPSISIEQAIQLRNEAKNKLRVGHDPALDKAIDRESKRVEKAKQIFQFSLSDSGGLTIKLNNSKLSLTPEQTEAMRAFLNAGVTHGSD